jgi:hypothetical protein
MAELHGCGGIPEIQSRQGDNMLNELRSQRVVLSIEVDRARRWRSSAALDKIKQSLEARLTILDKAIKAEGEKAGT